MWQNIYRRARDLYQLAPAGEPWFRWAAALFLVLLGTLSLLVLRSLVRRHARRIAAMTASRFDDLVVDLIADTGVPFLIATSALATVPLVDLSPRPAAVVKGIALVIVLFQVGRWGSRGLVEVVRRKFDQDGAADPTRRSASGLVGLAGRVVLWSVLFLVALDNIGVDITALVAGLGVGGIAIALATQNVLGDLFASVSILLDKPFVVGDFIVVGDFMGTVEQIGIKTTRLRSLGGEQIIFANADLLGSRVRNYKRMTERRIVFSLGIVYETPLDTVERIPLMLRQIVESTPLTRFDRAHFKAFQDFSLGFEVVYYVLDPDFTRYMDIQQSINLEIGRRFAREGIEMAYPTRTVRLERASRAARMNSSP